MFNINSRLGKLKYQQEIEREMQIMELRFSKSLRHVLGRQYMDSARLLELGIFNVQSVDIQKHRIQMLFTTHYKRVAATFYKKVLNSITNIKSDSPVENKATNSALFWQLITAYITANAASKVIQINATTKGLLQSIIQKGLEDGKSYVEIAKDIRSISSITNKYRSMSIAMTETHSISVYSIDSAIKSTGMLANREWMNTGDERVRTSPFDHMRANGEIVGPTEQFVMTGESLDYPGDPKGSAANIIRCRCVLLYHMMHKSVSYRKVRERNLMLRRNSNG